MTDKADWPTPEEFQRYRRMIGTAPEMLNFIRDLITTEEHGLWVLERATELVNYIDTPQESAK